MHTWSLTLLLLLATVGATVGAGLSSEEYQTGIREATAWYRGDLTEGLAATNRKYFSGSLDRAIRDQYLQVFRDPPVLDALLHDALSCLTPETKGQ